MDKSLSNRSEEDQSLNIASEEDQSGSNLSEAVKTAEPFELNPQTTATDGPAATADVKIPEPFELNPLTLAYIGDAVFEILVRKYMLTAGSLRVEKLHKKVTSVVNAGSQSSILRMLEPMFTEREEKVYKRARNSKPVTSAKNQSISDYRRATGLEAVFGYLYLSGQNERMNELFCIAMNEIQNKEPNC